MLIHLSHAEQQILARLRSAGATTPAGAVGFVPSDEMEAVALRGLLQRNGVLATSSGALYLHESRLAVQMRSRVSVLTVVGIVAAAIAVSGIAAALVF